MFWRKQTRSAPRRTSGAKPTFKPQVELLAARVVPATTYTWRGPAGGNWSTNTNWAPAGIPGDADTVLFNNTNVTDSNMDLGGGVAYHIARLQLVRYTGTVSLNSPLWVDSLYIDDGTVAGPKSLNISQQTGGAGGATIFEASRWYGGKIATNLNIWGAELHPATLLIKDTVGVPNLEGDLTIADGFSTVDWSAGNFIVAAGKKVTNFGTFKANSPGNFMGNNGNAQQKWSWINRADLILKAGSFKNASEDNKGGKVFKVQADNPNDNTFYVYGDWTQEDGGTTDVQSGTLSIVGNFAQTSGDTSINNESELTISGSMLQSGGIVSLGASLSTLTVNGSLQQSGGLLAAEYLGAHITVTGSVTVGSGAVLTLQFGGQLTASGGVTIQSGGILNAFVGKVIGTLINGGIINLAQDGIPYTLEVDGDFTQTANGTLNITLTDESTTARLNVTGTATLGGHLNVALDGVEPIPGSSYQIVEADTIAEDFDTWFADPPLDGEWNPDIFHGDPLDTYTLYVFD